MRFVPVLASGLETRNQLENRQEKNEFIFHRQEKIFLTKKTKRACPRENEKTIVRADCAATPGRHRSVIAAANCSG